jgi:hypothetical protein
MGRGFAVLTAGGVEPLGEAACSDAVRRFFVCPYGHTTNRPVEQIVGLVDEAEQRIGGGFGRSLLDIGPIIHSLHREVAFGPAGGVAVGALDQDLGRPTLLVHDR